MTGLGPRIGRRRLVAAASALTLVASLFVVAPATVVAANATITPATGGSAISLDTSQAGPTASWTALTGPAFAGAGAGDISAGNIVLSVPPGFRWNQFSGVAATPTGTCGSLVAGVPSVSSSTILVTLTGATTGACTVTFAGIQVQPTGTTPTAVPAASYIGISGTTAFTYPGAGANAGFLASVVGAATKLVFSTQPGGGAPNVAWSQQPVVAIADQFGNTVTAAPNTAITLAINSGPGALTCTTNPVTTSGGVAPFTGCKASAVGTLTLSATGGYTAAISNAFAIANAPTKLAFGQNPAGPAYGGQAFAVQPIVWVEDAGSAIVGTDFSTYVTLSIQSYNAGVLGAPTPTLSCTGGNTKQASAGIAAFTGCKIDKAYSAFVLRATSSPALTPADSAPPFNVAVGPAAALDFTSWPSSPTPALLAPQPAVQVTDLGGNDVALAGVPIQLSLVGPLTSNLTCDSIIALPNTRYTDGSGLAQFTGCTVTPSGSYWLHATGGALNAADSPLFSVGGGTSGQVVFTQQPLNANIGGATPTGTVGVAWSTQPIVQLRNVLGNPLTSDYTSRVTLSIVPGTGTSGAVLTCTGGNTMVVSGGLAAFSGCSIDRAGTSYQVRATVTQSSTVPVGTSADSLAFHISANVMQIAFTTQPLGAYSGYVPTGPAGTAFSIQPVVAVRTLTGATITSDYTSRVTLSIAPSTPTSGGPGTLTCTGGLTMTVAAGLASFTGCSINTPGTAYKLRATVTSSTTVPVGTYIDSYPFTLTQSTTTISLATYPSVVTWGDPFTLTIQFSITGNHSFTAQRLSPVDNGLWQNILTGTTDSTGRAVVQYTPRFNGQYKIVFAGDSTAGSATSNTTTVNVRNLVLLRPSWSGTKTVRVGFTETYTATVRPVPSGGLPGGVASVSFEFWKLSGGSWAKVKAVTVRLNSSGVGSLKYTWNSTGQWYIRARTLPNIYNFWGTSVVQRINVQ